MSNVQYTNEIIMKMLQVREREQLKCGRGGKRRDGGCTVHRLVGQERFRACEKCRGREGGVKEGLGGKSDREQKKKQKKKEKETSYLCHLNLARRRVWL